MGKLMAAIAALLTVIATFGTAAARADLDVQPAGSLPIPDGPAQTWIVADMDSGQMLAARDPDVAHPPASTIKVLLALVALDELNLNSTVVADVADTEVECNCVGIKPFRTYTARQLLDGLLLVSGNDAANTLAQMLGGPDAAVAKMNAKAASLGATNTHAATPSGLDGPGGSGATTAHDLAVIFRAAMGNPMFAQITAEPSAMFPSRSRRRTDPQPGRAAAALPRRARRQDGLHRCRAQDVRRRRRPRRPPAGDRHDVRAGETGRPDLLGSGGQPVRLGFRPQSAVQHRLAVTTCHEPAFGNAPVSNALSTEIRFSAMSGWGNTPSTTAAPSNTFVSSATMTGNVSSGKLSAPGSARAAS